LEYARDHDPAVCKVAGWWAPGGVRYERTGPRIRSPKRSTSL
jgi:hypothetical protein